MMTELDLQVFNGCASRSAGTDSYTVWRTRLLIALRARRLLSVVANVEDEIDNEDETPSIKSRQARATHIITAALGPVPFMAIQSLINDWAQFFVAWTKSIKEVTLRR
jgi:hypothetical protein